MGKAIEITRRDRSAEELRKEASRCRDGRMACRMLAIAHVLDGASRTEAAGCCGMDRQTLRDWAHRYNAGGIEGLRDARRSGRPSRLSKEQQGDLKELVLAGPDFERHGVVRWRCCDLRSEMAKRYNVNVHERTVGKILRKLGLSRVQPRPRHPKQEPAAQEAFKKTLLTRCRKFCRRAPLAGRPRFGFRTKRGLASKVR